MADLNMRAHRDELDFDPAPTGQSGKTLLGNVSLGTRSWLFFLACLLAIAAFGGLFYQVDKKLDTALQNMQQANRVDELVNAVERGTYSLQARQRDFLLSRDTTIADSFSVDLADVSTALDELFTYPDTRPLAQHVTTIRDGLVQYDQQFQAFLETERQIGVNTETGLSAQLGRTSATLRAAFRESGNANLVNQIERIDQQGEETILSGSKKGVEEIRNRYEALTAFVQAAGLDEESRTRIATLLQTHETQMLSIINARFDLARETRRFEELFEYFVPSLQGLAGFSDRARIEAAANVRNVQLFGRYTIVGGTLAILLWLMFFGLVLLKSLASPARRIADAVERITRGSRHTAMPAQGNKDDYGRIARLLDGWADTIVEADQIRSELERTQSRLDRALLDMDASDERVRDAEKRAKRAEEKARERTAQQSLGTDETPPTRSISQPPVDMPTPIETGEMTGGPITSVSQQLQSFTQYVTAAASDVERTEMLIKGIDQLGTLVNDIDDLVMTIRDQTNLLAFRNPGKEALRDTTSDDATLISFNGEANNMDAERAYAQKFDRLRDATDRTERIVMRVKETLDDVTQIAREIGETASQEALQATNKLLNQSEYLQNMLDDILNKIQPAKPGQLSAPRPMRRESEDPFA